MGYSFTDLGAEGCCRSLNALFFSTGPINNDLTLFQVMAWHWKGDKPLPESLTQIYYAKWRHYAAMS